MVKSGIITACCQNKMLRSFMQFFILWLYKHCGRWLNRLCPKTWLAESALVALQSTPNGSAIWSITGLFCSKCPYLYYLVIPYILLYTALLKIMITEELSNGSSKMSAFFCPAETVYLKANETRTVQLYFLPFNLGTSDATVRCILLLHVLRRKCLGFNFSS